MLNKEKFAKEILEVVCRGTEFALVGNEIKPCSEIDCKDCSFYAVECDLKKEKWANSEYVEPPVDWSKVAVDTPILVRDYDNQDWLKRHFAKCENSVVFSWTDGKTSWSNERTIGWKQAKLSESEETQC